MTHFDNHLDLRGNTIFPKLSIARSFIQRSRGLLGLSSLDSQQALWIHRCNSIHTFFMRFAIDAVFVDRQLMVVRIYKNLQPWRVTFPCLSAQSVFEMPTGSVEKHGIKKGDHLHVGP
jgi:uncharacterized membrane protein (UPF0127 family)